MIGGAFTLKIKPDMPPKNKDIKAARPAPHPRNLQDPKVDYRAMFNRICAGATVTFWAYNGKTRGCMEWKQKKGKAVMYGAYGWVLNTGGRYGTPAVVTFEHLISVRCPPNTTLKRGSSTPRATASRSS